MGVQVGNPDLSQPDNLMSRIGDEQRRKLLPQNAFSVETSVYSSVHPDANSTGDEIGRGTGKELDVYNSNIGTRADLIARKEDLMINKYSSENPYYTPTT
jgi:hypothetical protein